MFGRNRVRIILLSTGMRVSPVFILCRERAFVLVMYINTQLGLEVYDPTSTSLVPGSSIR